MHTDTAPLPLGTKTPWGKIEAIVFEPREYVCVQPTGVSTTVPEDIVLASTMVRMQLRHAYPPGSEGRIVRSYCGTLINYDDYDNQPTCPRCAERVAEYQRMRI